MDYIDKSLHSAARALLLAKPYDKITVGNLCQEANVSRASFYSHFTNKDALYKSVLLDDICSPITTIRSTISTMRYPQHAHFMIDETQFSNILENAEFYKRIVRERPLLFERSITNGLYEINASILKQYKMDAVELDYRAHFFAANHVALFKHWIESDFNVDVTVLSDWYHSWSTVCWSQSLPQ